MTFLALSKALLGSPWVSSQCPTGSPCLQYSLKPRQFLLYVQTTLALRSYGLSLPAVFIETTAISSLLACTLSHMLLLAFPCFGLLRAGMQAPWFSAAVLCLCLLQIIILFVSLKLLLFLLPLLLLSFLVRLLLQLVQLFSCCFHPSASKMNWNHLWEADLVAAATASIGGNSGTLKCIRISGCRSGFSLFNESSSVI